MGTALAWGVALGAAAAGFMQATAADAGFLMLLAVGLAVGLRASLPVGRRLAGLARGEGWAPLEPLMPGWPPPVSSQCPANGARRPAFARRLAMGGLGVLVGASAAAARLEALERALGPLATPRLAWVEGVAQGPWQFGRYDAALHMGQARLTGPSCARSARRPGDFPGEAIAGKVEVRASREVARQHPLQGGERVCVRGVIARPPEGDPWPAFSPRRYGLARGVVASLTVRLGSRMEVVASSPRPGVRAATALWARRLVAAVRRYSGRMAGNWFDAVAFGHRQALSEEEAESLRDSGLAHLTSVSGLHVGLASAPLMTLAAMARRRRAVRAALAGAACGLGWLYAAASGMQAPAVRALFVQGMGLALSLAGRRPDLLRSLGWAAAAQLVANPHLALDGGFQLSYAATCGIALALRGAARKKGPPPESPDPQGQRPGRGVRAAQRLGRTAAVSVGAWLFSAPLLVRYLGGSSPWGVMLSPPASALALILIWSGLGAGLLPEPLARVCALPVQAAAWGLRVLAAWGAELAGRWPLDGLGARGWALVAGVAAGRWIGSRFGAGAIGAAAATALVVLWPGSGPAVVTGVALGGGGWMIGVAPPTGPSLVVLRSPEGALDAGEALRTSRARGSLRGPGLLVVRADRSEKTDDGSVPVGLRGQRWAVLRWDPVGGGLTSYTRDHTGQVAMEQPVAGAWMQAMRITPTGRAEAPGVVADGLQVEIGTRDGHLGLRIDPKGCVYLDGDQGPYCPSGRGFRITGGPWGWDGGRGARKGVSGDPGGMVSG